MNRLWGVCVALSLAVIASACGGSESSANPPAQSPTTTPAAPPTTTRATATAAQYASIVSRQKASISDATKKAQAECPLIDPAAINGLCGIYVLTIQAGADTLAISLLGAQKEGVPAYIGPPPAEISILVNETVAIASGLSSDGNRVSKCSSNPDPTCAKDLSDFRLGMSRMQDQLAAWQPYGVA